MTYQIRFSRRAKAQIRVAGKWWLENRSKAPTAFEEEIERGLKLLRILPSVGEPVHHSRLKGVRRVLLGRIHYHFYYVVSRETETVEILALWHVRRGSLPKL